MLFDISISKTSTKCQILNSFKNSRHKMKLHMKKKTIFSKSSNYFFRLKQISTYSIRRHILRIKENIFIYTFSVSYFFFEFSVFLLSLLIFTNNLRKHFKYLFRIENYVLGPRGETLQSMLTVSKPIGILVSIFCGSR